MDPSLDPRHQIQRLVVTTAAAWGLRWPRLPFAISY
jgi:hypothetical protein